MQKGVEEIRESFELGRCIKSFGFEYICEEDNFSEIHFQKEINPNSYHSILWDRDINKITICSYELEPELIGKEFEFTNIQRLFSGYISNKETFATIYNSIISAMPEINK